MSIGYIKDGEYKKTADRTLSFEPYAAFIRVNKGGRIRSGTSYEEVFHNVPAGTYMLQYTLQGDDLTQANSQNVYNYCTFGQGTYIFVEWSSGTWTSKMFQHDGGDLPIVAKFGGNTSMNLRGAFITLVRVAP